MCCCGRGCVCREPWSGGTVPDRENGVVIVKCECEEVVTKLPRALTAVGERVF